MRNLRGGFYDIVVAEGEPHLPQGPQVVQAWNELTLILSAA
jgi:hypothetical protein